MRGRAWVALFVCVLAAGGLAACGDDDDSDETGGGDEVSTSNELSIVETDYDFAVEGEPTAGTLSIKVANEGAEFHEIGMFKLLPGKTADDVRTALEGAGEEDDPLNEVAEDESQIDDLGGVQQPGTAYSITGSGIEAGEYVVLCFLPTSDGESHYSLGMLEQFTIAAGNDGEAPQASATYTATDDGLDGPEELSAGVTTIDVVNDSTINRELFVVKVKDDKTVADAEAWFEEAGDDLPDAGTTPLDFFAFMFDAEQDRTLTVDLTPGTWVIVSADPENPFEGPVTDDPAAMVVTVT